jgi:hypothetical protein
MSLIPDTPKAFPLIQGSAGYNADLSVSAGATVTDFSGANKALDLPRDVEDVLIVVSAKGANASSAGNVSFYFELSLDGTNWIPVAIPLVAVVAATATVFETDKLDARGFRAIRLKSVVNGDATYAATVNGILKPVCD